VDITTNSISLGYNNNILNSYEYLKQQLLQSKIHLSNEKKQNLKDKILQNWSGNSNVKKQAVIYLVEKCTLYAEHGSRIILTAPKSKQQRF